MVYYIYRETKRRDLEMSAYTVLEKTKQSGKISRIDIAFDTNTYYKIKNNDSNEILYIATGSDYADFKKMINKNGHTLNILKREKFVKRKKGLKNQK